jgi:hypothetical protein
VTYWNDELFGEGTVLNVSHLGCRMVGTMTVEEGMRLQLWISPPNKADQLCVQEARVLKVREHEFGIGFQRLAAIDGPDRSSCRARHNELFQDAGGRALPPPWQIDNLNPLWDSRRQKEAL